VHTVDPNESKAQLVPRLHKLRITNRLDLLEEAEVRSRVLAIDEDRDIPGVRGPQTCHGQDAPIAGLATGSVPLRLPRHLSSLVSRVLLPPKGVLPNPVRLLTRRRCRLSRHSCDTRMAKRDGCGDSRESHPNPRECHAGPRSLSALIEQPRNALDLRIRAGALRLSRVEADGRRAHRHHLANAGERVLHGENLDAQEAVAPVLEQSPRSSLPTDSAPDTTGPLPPHQAGPEQRTRLTGKHRGMMTRPVTRLPKAEPTRTHPNEADLRTRRTTIQRITNLVWDAHSRPHCMSPDECRRAWGSSGRWFKSSHPDQSCPAAIGR
jgi:hypothetical protein